ncbi:MAG: hypothetical protein ACK4YT_02530 [Sphingomonas sp.]
MSNDPVFDPIFNTAPQPQQGGVVPEGMRYRFDGWSYQPLVTKITEPRPAPPLEPRQ